jgi:hypothetical protein
MVCYRFSLSAKNPFSFSNVCKMEVLVVSNRTVQRFKRLDGYAAVLICLYGVVACGGANSDGTAGTGSETQADSLNDQQTETLVLEAVRDFVRHPGDPPPPVLRIVDRSDDFWTVELVANETTSRFHVDPKDGRIIKHFPGW